MNRAAVAILFVSVCLSLMTFALVYRERAASPCASPAPGTPVVWRGVVEGKA